MKKSVFSFEYEILDQNSIVDKNILTLLENALSACHQAYAPYSGFHVGCALLLEDDTVIIGSNQENAAYPSGLCAERVALFHYGTNYKSIPIKAMAITAVKATDNPLAPCGACRQVILEYANMQKEKPIEVYFKGKDKTSWYKIPDSRYLLPFPFESF
jgi:cytidine deaminase